MIIPAIKQLAIQLHQKTYVQRVWEYMNGEMYVNMRSKEPRWPRCVFTPGYVVSAYIRRMSPKHLQQMVNSAADAVQSRRTQRDDVSWEEQVRLETVSEWQLLGALGAWIPTQGVYIFNEDLFEQVWQPYSGQVSENIVRLPEWGTFIKIPDNSYTADVFLPIIEDVDGFLIWLDWDNTESVLMLCIRPIFKMLGTTPAKTMGGLKVQLFPGRTIEECITGKGSVFARHAGDRLHGRWLDAYINMFRCLISLVSYLGDRTADYERRESMPRPKKSLRGGVFPEIEPVVYHVGSVLGPVLGYMKKKVLTNQKATGGVGGFPLSGPSVTRAHRQGYHVIQDDGSEKLEDRWKFPYFRGFVPDDWMDRPVVLRKVFQVQPSLCKRYPEIAHQLNIKITLPHVPNLYSRVEENGSKRGHSSKRALKQIQSSLHMNRKGDFEKKKKKKRRGGNRDAVLQAHCSTL